MGSGARSGRTWSSRYKVTVTDLSAFFSASVCFSLPASVVRVTDPDSLVALECGLECLGSALKEAVLILYGEKLLISLSIPSDSASSFPGIG